VKRGQIVKAAMEVPAKGGPPCCLSSIAQDGIPNDAQRPGCRAPRLTLAQAGQSGGPRAPALWGDGFHGADRGSNRSTAAPQCY
jgi:hypothetical protein